MADAPIGIFDSGFGGLTVARAVLDQLPHEPIVYLGDTARQPYGPKPIGELAEHFRGSDLTNAVVVSPDLGNAKTASQFARLLGVPVAAGSKQRLADDTVVIDAIVGDVAGKRAIVLDDEIATGGSIVELIDRLVEHGCPEVSVACTHGLFSGGAVERLRGLVPVKEFVTTDTVPSPQDWPELQVRSVATLFAEAIRRSHLGESVSSLFDGVDPAYAPPQPRLPF